MTENANDKSLLGILKMVAEEGQQYLPHPSVFAVLFSIFRA